MSQGLFTMERSYAIIANKIGLARFLYDKI